MNLEDVKVNKKALVRSVALYQDIKRRSQETKYDQHMRLASLDFTVLHNLHFIKLSDIAILCLIAQLFANQMSVSRHRNSATFYSRTLFVK
jgi:hypothetical protein